MANFLTSDYQTAILSEIKEILLCKCMTIVYFGRQIENVRKNENFLLEILSLKV